MIIYLFWFYFLTLNINYCIKIDELDDLYLGDIVQQNPASNGFNLKVENQIIIGIMGKHVKTRF